MNSISNNVKILFRYAKPEKVTGTYDKNMQTICYNDIPRKLYIQYARECYPNKSDNELTEYYNQLKNYITLLNSKDFFYLLSDFGKQSLDICNGTPVVKFESIVNWQDTSHEIGQSVIVAAYLARNSLEKGVKQDFFAWPTTLRTNNRQLQNILNEGISENHYHLNGSTQVFPITWVSLMNIPTKIPSVTKKINVNLAPHTSFGEKDNQLSWNLLLKEAAIIRYNLFCRTHNYDNIITYDHSCVSFANLQRKIVALSHTEAFKFSKGKYFLDYAINKNTSENNLGCNRVLVGERKFLYDCFKASFSGKFSYTENNLFYKYLLIKSNFRSEIIQNNRFTGFENFSNYQNRKSYAIDGVYKYECEAIGTAINEVLDVQPILSLEARVMPRENRKRLISDINFYDTTYKKKLLENKKSYDDVQKIHFPYFYVLHYPKGCEKAKKNMLFIPKPRNFKQRKKYKKCSLTTMNCLNHRSFLRDRILGIDTCSNEIGCRPEVFATEYRYLKNFNMYHHQLIKASTQERSYLLNRTYHVGEDFLDLVDGLRAIDEVIKFLEFSHGDRFGHALALGVNPKEYYQFKNHTIILPKQDALDNFVWMYMRSNEMNISIEPLLKQKLESKINELANIIYGDFVRKFSISNLSLDPYSLYCAWKLRGDNPECYKTIKFMVDPAAHTQYDRAKYAESDELRRLRNREEICSLYYAYHYEYSVRKEGEKPYEFEVIPEYISLVTEIQKKLQFEVAEKGIMIECNPSSNCLIGTFKTYDKHPIRTFYNLHLEKDYELIDNCAQISVSINTDDQGVFDTSLEYEYALMAAALMSIKKDDGQVRYSPAQVYEYLDSIRKMGNVQSFRNTPHNNGYRNL